MADGSLGLGIALGLLGATLPGKKPPDVCGVHRVSQVHLVSTMALARPSDTYFLGRRCVVRATLVRSLRS